MFTLLALVTQTLAPLPAGSPSGAPPIVAGSGCASSLRDQDTGSCLSASSSGQLGHLYPLSLDFNVLAGRVGMGRLPWLAKLTIQSTNSNTLSLLGPGPYDSLASLQFGDPGLVYLFEDLDDALEIHAYDRIALTGGRVGIETLDPIAFVDSKAILDVGGNVVVGAVDDGFGSVQGALATVGPQGYQLVNLSWPLGDTSAGYMGTFYEGIGNLTALTTSVLDSTDGYVGVYDTGFLVAGIDGHTGEVFGASKTFVQPHPTDATKEICYVALEGPENAAYFRGSARLVGGLAQIDVPDHFRHVVADEGLTVQVTPLGPTSGLWVAEKTRDRILVRENPGGLGDVAFDYVVTGVRSALPANQAVRANTRFAPQPGSRVAAGDLPGHYRDLMIANGTLHSDGTVVDSTAHAQGWRFEDGEWRGPQPQADTRAEIELPAKKPKPAMSPAPKGAR